LSSLLYGAFELGALASVSSFPGYRDEAMDAVGQLAQLQDHIFRFGYRQMRPEGSLPYKDFFVCPPSVDEHAEIAW